MARRVLKFRTYDLVEEAVSRAVDQGWLRAHKLGIEPHEDAILHAIESAVMEELAEVIDFDRS